MRRGAIVVAVAIAFVATACGSSSDGSAPTTAVAPTSSVPVTVPPSMPSAPTTSSTAPALPGDASTCSRLAGTVTLAELQPRDLGNWPAERQRVITDTATNAVAYEAAASGAPASLVDPLGALAVHAREIGSAVEGAGSLAAARSAIAALPDRTVASRAATTVEDWQRANCR